MAENKVMKVGDPEKETTLASKYSAYGPYRQLFLSYFIFTSIDFGNSMDFVKFQGVHKNKLIEFIKILASKQVNRKLCIFFYLCVCFVAGPLYGILFSTLARDYGDPCASKSRY